ncbi:GNAT family N-acetyltransferase [Niveispirillum lacus]|uniref:GNAT family N-acetyltransferase n=2 Tax=Niveispirillum lacus TaxID=1981099 RepID=A0A255YYS2_9PROT|nr:GNAT family N-acetyltransferase [Niveispirillum lacus]
MRIRAAVQENRLRDPSRVPASAYQAFLAVSPIWLFEDEGGIRGFAAADPRDGSIWALFTDPAAEGRGVGKALLSYALNDLKQAGWEQAHLSTDCGTRADRFYRAQGWAPTGLTEGGEQGFVRAL